MAFPIVGPILSAVASAGRAIAGSVLGRAVSAAVGVARSLPGSMAGRGVRRTANFATENYWVLDSILSKVSDNLDSFTHAITVKVVGGPAADLRRVYYLACAAAFGRYSRGVTRVGGSYFEMSCSADITDKSVQITIGYNTGLLGDVGRSQSSGPVRTPLDVMFDGPDQVTIGRGWAVPFFTSSGVGSRYANVTPGTVIRGGGVKTIPLTSMYDAPEDIKVDQGGLVITIDQGRNVWQVDQPEVLRLLRVPVIVFRPYAWEPINPDVLREIAVTKTGTRTFYLRRVAPTNLRAFTEVRTTDNAAVPVLPDDGRLITTGETRDPRVQPPRPPVDGIARGSILSLTVQALTEPGYLPGLPRLTSVPLATGGFYLEKPGTTVRPGNGGVPVNRDAPPEVDGFGGLFGGTGATPVRDRVPVPLLRDPAAPRPRIGIPEGNAELRG